MAASTVGAMSGSERIAAAFAAAPGRAALMPYMMGGFPDPATSLRIAHAYADGGADLVELGLPFSDPLADGPVIQAAGSRALAAGVKVADVLTICTELSARLPVVMMVYVNIVIAYGYRRFAETIAAAGASGLIVPDLPLEEAEQAAAACSEHGIAFVPLVAPTSTDARLSAIGKTASGFLYTVAVTGTTGERTGSRDQYTTVIARARAATDVPVALGFGISGPEQAAAAAAAGADGVIVGSRLVRSALAATDAGDDPAAEALRLVAEFARGLRAD